MGLNWSQLMLAQNNYITISMLLIAATGLALVILILTHLLGPRRVGERKHDTYESGMEPVGDTRRRFSVRFYLIAVLFLIFDVEVLFLIPWAVLFPRLKNPAAEQQAWAESLAAAGYDPAFVFVAAAVFFALLLVGFVYEWRRGVFKWN